MRDVPSFHPQGQEIYGYPHFVNDVGGSLCELDEPGVVGDCSPAHLILLHPDHHREEEDHADQRAQSRPQGRCISAVLLAEYLPC